MSPEVWSIIAVGVGLAGLMLSVRQDVRNLLREVANLWQRVARLEGAFPFLAQQAQSAPGSPRPGDG